MPSLLKKIDWLSKFYPHPLNIAKSLHAKTERYCIIRPGGLGDLVVTTRACNSLGISPASLDWIVEKRNAKWLDYLGVSHLCYDRLSDLKEIALRYGSYQKIILSEQYHGLAAIVASYLATAQGEIIGFHSNPRCDIFTTTITHAANNQHEYFSFIDLLNAATDRNKNSSSELKTEAKESGSHILIALAGEYDSNKLLSINEWKQLLLHAKRYSLPIYLVGTEQLSPLAAELCFGESSITNLVGKIPFVEVVNKIKEAKRFVGIDSGLMHVADYFCVPSDVVFKQNKTQWRPLTQGSIITNTAAELLGIKVN